jgi:hypothetical protein
MHGVENTTLDMLNSWWYDLAIGIFFVLLLAINEVYIDKKLKYSYQKWLGAYVIIDTPIAYKVYSRVAHDLQLPFRAIALILFAVVVAGDNSIWPLLVYIIYLGFVYWFQFDILVNKLWLDKKWWYIGGTSKSDDLFNDNKGELILFWSIKILGILGFGVIYFFSHA